MTKKRLAISGSIKKSGQDVTCIVPFYGTTDEDVDTLKLTLRSLREQTLPIKHVIVINDGLHSVMETQDYETIDGFIEDEYHKKPKPEIVPLAYSDEEKKRLNSYIWRAQGKPEP